MQLLCIKESQEVVNLLPTEGVLFGHHSTVALLVYQPSTMSA